MKKLILLVEDELDLGNAIKEYLEGKDFEVDWYMDAESALLKIRAGRRPYLVFLLDVSLPGMGGFQLARELDQLGSKTPFIFLTARGEKEDRLLGFTLGADDYVVKPFDIDELVLRISSIIRRTVSGGHGPGVASPSRQGKVINVHDVSFNPGLNKLSVRGKDVSLTAREAELLYFLFGNANRILTREEILTKLWGEYDFFLGRSLDVFVSRLRKHLSQTDKIVIKNVYGTGFIFSIL
ncbi:MAG: response regulator transcription factor [Bacteroidetes bacterium]|nr:response regulator transcription factor [Bacteroidota bacterium]